LLALPCNFPMNDEMLNKWSSLHAERSSIEDFWAWLEETQGNVPLYDLHLSKLLDEYHGIDRAQLESERRLLLASLG